MSTVILSAAGPEFVSLQKLAALLEAELRQSGETDIRLFELSATKLAYCQGEFDCWVKTPGRCRAHDAEGAILSAIHDAAHLVVLDAVTFGGHSYTLKRAQDRLICLLSPFFEKRASLTHHKARYERTANFFALGWMPVADLDAMETWCALADANALNLLAPLAGAAVVDDTGEADWPTAIRSMLASTATPGSTIVGRASLRRDLIEAATGAPGLTELGHPRRAAIVVGSAKIKGTSASETMARALGARLVAAGVATEIHFATEFLHDEKALATARGLANADLLVLVTPLYVDSFPALATRALENVARVRAGTPAAGRFAVLVNCGFPEPEHNRTALRIARHFARRSGYEWAGGLPLGGGAAIDPMVPLDAQHGPAEHVKRALDLAAECLANGRPISLEAVETMAKSPLPDSIYRFMGDFGWRYQAYKNGLAQTALLARPLDNL
ncbi:MAG: hypothetical protein SFV18_08965 [Bryobacteraceae bacterium]|nr:hypothetical protein [Bryobacteraceae bacterium]